MQPWARSCPRLAVLRPESSRSLQKNRSKDGLLRNFYIQQSSFDFRILRCTRSLNLHPVGRPEGWHFFYDHARGVNDDRAGTSAGKNWLDSRALYHVAVTLRICISGRIHVYRYWRPADIESTRARISCVASITSYDGLDDRPWGSSFPKIISWNDDSIFSFLVFIEICVIGIASLRRKEQDEQGFFYK